MEEELPRKALYPSTSVHACRVDTHPVLGADGIVQVHVTRYGLDRPDNASYRAWEAMNHLQLHLLAAEPTPISETEHQRLADSPREQFLRVGTHSINDALTTVASVVIAPHYLLPPMLVLDRIREQRSQARVVGVVTSDRSALVWIKFSRTHAEETSGYVVTMSSDEPGPVTLYPSALYGWALWWAEHEPRLTEGDLPFTRLPVPPPYLDVVEAWRPYRVRLEQPQRLTWPASMPEPHVPWDDTIS